LTLCKAVLEAVKFQQTLSRVIRARDDDGTRIEVRRRRQLCRQVGPGALVLLEGSRPITRLEQGVSVVLNNIRVVVQGVNGVVVVVVVVLILLIMCSWNSSA